MRCVLRPVMMTGTSDFDRIDRNPSNPSPRLVWSITIRLGGAPPEHFNSFQSDTELHCGRKSTRSRSALSPDRYQRDHRSEAIRNGTYEVPLFAAKMAGTCNEGNPLVELAKLNTKPAFALSAHVRANNSSGNFNECVHVIPRPPMFAPGLMKPFRASRFRSSFNPSCRQTRSRGRGIRRGSMFKLEIAILGLLASSRCLLSSAFRTQVGHCGTSEKCQEATFCNAK